MVEVGVVAHGCNNAKDGVMGAGVALFLRRKYPQIFDNYSKLCSGDDQSREQLLGTVDFVIINQQLIIANCFTQHLYGRNGRYAIPEAIEESLNVAMSAAQDCELPFYMPKIGAGLGGLDWEQDVEPIVNKLSTNYEELPIYVCVWGN